ncbi:hypothetical protein [Cryptosporangium sp. NPDC051539]|uniref:hypothetical protein n=1 Tax=Cryptosporangium sp. NPDC051539 TaxID=3363962 RepID=UPI0037A16430
MLSPTVTGPARPVTGADTALRAAIAARRPVRRVIRYARAVLSAASVCGFAAWAVTGHAPWSLTLGFGSLALIALGGLASWPLPSFGGWTLRAEVARVTGDWAQALVLALGCAGLLAASLSETYLLVGAVVGLFGVTLGWTLPSLAWALIGAPAADRERATLARYQRVAQTGEIARAVSTGNYPALPRPVVLQPDVDEPVSLTHREFDDCTPDDFDSARAYLHWLENGDGHVLADRRAIVLTGADGRSAALTTAAAVVVVVAAGLDLPSTPVFDADTEARLRGLAGDVESACLLDAAGRRVADLPGDGWSVRELASLAGAAGIPCRVYRVDEDVLDRCDGVTPSGVGISFLSVHFPAAPDAVE